MICTDDRIDLVQNEEVFPNNTDNDNSPPSIKESHQISQPSVHPPIDYRKNVYLIFYLLGIITMTPWNFFITAESYWMFKFRNVTANGNHSEEDLTPMQKSFASDLTLTASVSGTIFLVLHAIYGQKFSHRLKIVGCLITIFLMFTLTAVFVDINTDQWQEQFFVITLCTVLVLNVSSAVMCGAIFGLAALFPLEYMTAIVSGQSLGGIISALIYILIVAFRATPTETAFIYFVIGTLLVLITIVCYITLEKNSFFNYFINMHHIHNMDICSNENNTNSCNSTRNANCNAWEILYKIYTHATSICLLFVITVSIYPSVAVLMQSVNYGHGNIWNDVYYMPVVNYLLFNSGDYFGRILAGIFDKYQYDTRTILLLVIIRAAYVPLFLCSNSNLHRFLPTLIHSDIVFIIMMITFAVTNGYLTNMLLTTGPRKVKQEEREMASAIMAASLSCGMALGSLFSLLFVQML